MAGEIAIPISVYAAAEASDARRAAERAEMQAFVNGYNHATATPEQRQRYVDAVKVLYPVPAERTAAIARQEVFAKKVIGGGIVSIALLFAISAAYGKFVLGDIEEGMELGLKCFVASFFSFLVFGIVGTGVWLLCFA